MTQCSIITASAHTHNWFLLQKLHLGLVHNSHSDAFIDANQNTIYYILMLPFAKLAFYWLSGLIFQFLILNDSLDEYYEQTLSMLYCYRVMW